MTVSHAKVPKILTTTCHKLMAPSRSIPVEITFFFVQKSRPKLIPEINKNTKWLKALRSKKPKRKKNQENKLKIANEEIKPFDMVAMEIAIT